jgi:hypothetical protein
MPRRTDDPARGPKEPVFTTLAVGEEGDSEPRPDPVHLPEEPVFTTLALGEEGDPGLDPWGA